MVFSHHTKTRQTEPRNRYVQTEGEQHIKFYDIDSDVSHECDVSLAHQWQKDIVKGAAKNLLIYSDITGIRKSYKYRAANSFA